MVAPMPTRLREELAMTVPAIDDSFTSCFMGNSVQVCVWQPLQQNNNGPQWTTASPPAQVRDISKG